MSDNRDKGAVDGAESGQGFKGKKSNIGNFVNPPKKKLVKSMMAEYIAESVVKNIKKKKKIKPTHSS